MNKSLLSLLSALTFLAAAVFAVPISAGAQDVPGGPVSQEAAPPSAPAPDVTTSEQPVVVDATRHRRAPVVRFGQDYVVPADVAIREVVLISGSVTVAGDVGELVVVAGDARLQDTASVGSLVVVGGNVTVADGATVRREAVIVGGGLQAPPGFSPGGEYVAIGAPLVGDWVRAITPWFTQGPLLGRVFVPSLPWIWALMAIVFVAYSVLTLVFDGPIRRCAATLDERPLRAFVAGVLVYLLIGPVSMLLVVSVVGIIVLPLLLGAVAVAAIFGRIGVIVWLGGRLLRPASSDSRLQLLSSLAIGSAVVLLAYMVPVVGFFAFALLGVFGMGAAALALLESMRREKPVAPDAVEPPPPSGSGPRPDFMEPMRPDVPITPIAAPPASQAYAEPANFVSETRAPPFPPPAAPRAPSDLTLFPRAEFMERVAAFTLDVLLVVIVWNVLDIRHEQTAVLLFIAYRVGFWVWKGTTVGGIVCNLRLVKTNGAPLEFVDAFVRGLSSLLSFAALGLGCFWVLRDPERQAWHDKIAGTYVVKVPRNYPLPGRASA